MSFYRKRRRRDESEPSSLDTHCPHCTFNLKNNGDCAADYEGCGRFRAMKSEQWRFDRRGVRREE